MPACFGFNRGSSDTLAEQSDDSFVMIVLMQLALLAFCSFIGLFCFFTGIYSNDNLSRLVPDWLSNAGMPLC